jgi:hypothetical protein
VDVKHATTFEGQLVSRIAAPRHVRAPDVFDGKLREAYFDTRFRHVLIFLPIVYEVREDTARVRVASLTPGGATRQHARVA